MLIVDPANPPRLSVRSASRHYGLTEAETDVAEKLVAGHAAGDIAEMRGASPDTVRNQTRKVYEKLGVRNRAELVRKIASISPPIGR